MDRSVEENTFVFLVTKPPVKANLDAYKDLETRGFFVYFNERLHSKLYLFNIDPSTLNQYTKDTKPTAILGSSNLTDVGLGMGDGPSNEELCYRIPLERFKNVRDSCSD